MAQDDYYYEIQLTNKQLVFYFMAGATGLILSFLAGVMVGRSVEGGSEPRSLRAAGEERIVTEEIPRPVATPTTVDLTYAQRLESDRGEEGVTPKPTATPTPLPTPRAALATPPASPSPATPPAMTPTAVATPPVQAAPAAVRPTPTPKPTPRPAPTATPTPTPTPRPAGPVRPEATLSPAAASASSAKDPKVTSRSARATKPVPGTFASQVGAFKDRATADQIVSRLRSRGYGAFVVVEKGGLFNVRVGNFEARADAERVRDKLRDEEKFKPFIVKQ